jgi:putative PEP-CTERM system histidine kinase
MSSLTWPFFQGIASAGWGLLLVAVLLARRASDPFCRHVALFLAAVGVAHVSDVMLLLDMPHVLVWRSLSFSGELLSVPALLYASISFMEFRDSAYRRTARWRAAAVLGIALALTGMLWFGGFFLAARNAEGRGVVVLGSFGRVAYLFIVFAAVLTLSHLEQLLRQSPDLVRYRFKLVWIGLGGMMAYELFRASQYLLIPAFHFGDVSVHGSVSLVCLGLVSWGLVRTRWGTGTGRVTVSEQALYGSITVIMAGVYLIAVGGIGEWVVEGRREVDLSIWSFVLFLCVISFVLLSTSRVFWVALQQIRARFLYQSKHDYRAKWMEVVDAFSETIAADAILDRLLALLGRTFGAGRISVWLQFDVDQRYHQVRTVNRFHSSDPVGASHHLVARMLTGDESIDVEEVDSSPQSTMRTEDPFLSTTQAALIVPIKADGRLLGFVTLSRDPYSGQYGTDDRELLRGIAYHVGVLLAHARLVEERISAARFEALHEFSSFCLHDIKNLALRLSLVVQNAKVRGTNPMFVESAFKTIAGTVEKMNDLMGKLSAQSEARLNPYNVPIDIKVLIQDVVRSLPNSEEIVTMGTVGDVLVPIREDNLRQVLHNLLLNAQQAGSHNSHIKLETKLIHHRLVLTFTDSGHGISKDRLRKLFVPFRSTKPSGLGVGLYQTKSLVESAGGSIVIESLEGSGTTVRIELPLFSQDSDLLAQRI